MNVEYEIRRVAGRHINLINEYSKHAKDLFPSDIINGTRKKLEIVIFITLF
jgi:hypothetical protein